MLLLVEEQIVLPAVVIQYHRNAIQSNLTEPLLTRKPGWCFLSAQEKVCSLDRLSLATVTPWIPVVGLIPRSVHPCFSHDEDTHSGL